MLLDASASENYAFHVLFLLQCIVYKLTAY